MHRGCTKEAQRRLAMVVTTRSSAVWSRHRSKPSTSARFISRCITLMLLAFICISSLHTYSWLHRNALRCREHAYHLNIFRVPRTTLRKPCRCVQFRTTRRARTQHTSPKRKMLHIILLTTTILGRGESNRHSVRARKKVLNKSIFHGLTTHSFSTNPTHRSASTTRAANKSDGRDRLLARRRSIPFPTTNTLLPCYRNTTSRQGTVTHKRTCVLASNFVSLRMHEYACTYTYMHTHTAF